MNLRFVNRLNKMCIGVIVAAVATLLVSNFWGGPSVTLCRMVIIFELIAMAGLVFCTVRLYQCGIPGKGMSPGNLPLPEKSRLELLKEHAEYDRSRQEKPYTYEFRMGGKVPAILEKYDYSKYLQGVRPGTDEVAFRMLDFVCDHFHHGPTARAFNGKLTEQIKQYEKTEHVTNCRGLSKLLSSLLLLNGIKARFVTCRPYEEPFNDCHVVVDCVLPSGKRIMLDPTYRLYLMDKQDEYLSIEGLRRALLADEEITYNPNAGYNGGTFGPEDLADYRDYMAKNLIRISSGVLCADGKEEWDVRQVILVPKGYPIEKFKYTGNFVFNDEQFWRI